MMEDKLVTIAEYQSDLEAQLAKTTLQGNDIEAVIMGETVKHMMPFDGMLIVQLQVFQRDVERAKKLLEDQQNQSVPKEENL